MYLFTDKHGDGGGMFAVLNGLHKWTRYLHMWQPQPERFSVCRANLQHNHLCDGYDSRHMNTQRSRERLPMKIACHQLG
jgi:hypothetical protein